MKKLLSIFLLLGLAFGVYAKLSDRTTKGYVPLEEYKFDASKHNPNAFTFEVKTPTQHLLWYSSLVRPFFPEFESHFEGEIKADYLEQLTGSLASPRGPTVQVAGPPIGQRIAAPRPVAAPSGTTLFLDETGLGSAAVAPSIPRRLTTSYTGSLIRVRRSSDNTEQDFGYNGSNELDTTSLLTFCSGTDGFVVTVYDQSGNGRNLTQSTASLQPQIVSGGTIYTGANSKPECRFDGSNDRMTATSWSLVAPMTVFMVAKQITWGTGYMLDGTSANGMALTGITSTPTLRIFLGAASVSNSGLAVGTPGLMTMIWNTTSRFQVNANAEVTGGDGTSRTPGGVSLGSAGSAANFYNFGFQEMVIYSGEKNSTDRTTARNNFDAFYDVIP